jgi:hypothetical protein
VPFFVGDRVRFLHDIGEGTITREISAGFYEVAVDGQMESSFYENELVGVSVIEKSFQKDKPTVSVSNTPAKAFSRNGMYLAFEIIPGEIDYKVVLINNSDATVLFNILEEKDVVFTYGIDFGILEPKKSKILNNFPQPFTTGISQKIIFQFLYCVRGRFPANHPVDYALKIKPSLLKHVQPAPVTLKDSYILNLDQEAELIIPAKEIKTTQTLNPVIPQINIETPETEIDLHIERLVSNPKGLDTASIIKIQMDKFEQEFNRALAAHIPKLTVIHGVGNGILRMKIRKFIDGIADDITYKDASQVKYGHGATDIFFN